MRHSTVTPSVRSAGRGVRWRRLVAGLVAGLAAAATPAAAQAPAQPLKKVTIAAGAQLLDSSYPWLMMPQALGYWREAGYDVKVFATGGSLQAMQQVVGGNADFAQVNSTAVIQANAMNDVAARVVIANGIVDWAVIVPENSPVKAIAELKGKNIGVPSLGTGGIPLLRAYLRDNGLNPDSDVHLIPIGIGASALEAINADKVQAAMYWRGMIVIFENKGAKFRSFRAPDWDRSIDYTFTALQSTIDKDPAMVEAIARGAIKGTLFAMANPDCVRRLQWELWPNSKPSGADEPTLIRWDLANLNAQLDTLRRAYEVFGGSKVWGQPTADSYGRMQDFLFDAKVISKKIAPETLLLPAAFYQKINDFDHNAVAAEAKACRAK
jgi:NitT/TauT family transport system substrate-binding protein